MSSSRRVCSGSAAIRRRKLSSSPLVSSDTAAPPNPASSAEGRAVVTENVADFAAERDLVLVFVLKKNLPAGDGQAAALARILDRWDRNQPDPYLGHHWPAMD